MQLFRALQTPLPLIGRPFDELARGVDASEDELIEFVKHHSRRTGLGDYAALFSEREFKKQRLRYFLPELDRWWRERA